MRLGDLEIHILSDGRFRLDGGAMYGAVPRARWEPLSPADEHHRIEMDLHCTLIKTPQARVLVDTGIGPDVTDENREHWALQRRTTLLEQLQAVGVAPEDVTHVVFTHLHFDHAGGGGRLGRPLFPGARYVVQRREWDAAHAANPKAQAAYPRATLEPLHQASHLWQVDGEVEITPQVRVIPTGGHTWGHQVVLAENDDGGLLCWGDLLPLAPYARPLWVCGYDVDPEGSVTQKLTLARQAAERGWRVVTSHDPGIQVGVIEHDRRKNTFSLRAAGVAAGDG